LTQIGYQSLNISLVLSIYAILLYSLGGRQRNRAFIASANRAIYAIFALVSFSSLALLYALVTRQFHIEYVADYSNRSLPLFYTLAAFWAGQAGSLLLWVWLLAFFAVIVVWQNRRRDSLLFPYTMAVLSITLLFFIYLTSFKTNPFAPLPYTPPDGKGLNPLLQNPEMIFHPPSLYVGFVGFAVPFAYAIAALITRDLDEGWVKSIRRWTLFSWLFLTIGNILGMQWAYVELGWGGYWAWDPVENASLLPWLTGTAFLHTIIVQERKGMLKTWNVSLVVITFALTIFGTFVTRSGLISSVHAFGVSNLGPLFLGFLAFILVGSGFLIISRSALLKSKREMGSWTSKESSFLLNNILFIAMTLGVFIGTIMPTLSELSSGEKMTVGPPFFNRLSVPIGIAIFLLTGLCALFSLGKTSKEKLSKNLLMPGIAATATVAALAISGIRQVAALIAIGVAVFAIIVTLLEFIKGAIVRKHTDNLNILAALVSLAMRNKRRYGGYIVHLGVLLLFWGIIGSSAFSVEKTATLPKDSDMEIGRYKLAFTGLTTREKSGVQIIRANFDVSKYGRAAGTIFSEKHLHPNFQPATEVGIRSNAIEDLYVILAGYDLNADMVTVSVIINPLMIWMWIGGIIMILGTLLAISPGRKKASIFGSLA
jgi:cytochrome c-type biogenesis protein CcmF